jgi:class 3 adenylate cyclase
MSWDKEKSLERIRRRWEARDTEITVTKLTRGMNLENITLRNGRLIRGAHLYATVAGTGDLDCLDTEADAASAIQRIALWQAEVARIAKAFDVPIIAFQGARVHLLVYRPIDDDEAIARKAALLGRAITFMTRDAFNPLFDEGLRLKARAAADLGETVATRGGTRGDSELLFLGNAANRPAKLLGSSKLVVTGRFVDALGDQLEHEKEAKAGEDDAYLLKLSLATVEEAVAEDGLDWSIETSTNRLTDELEKWPVERFKVSGATELIDPKNLSRSSSKLVTATVALMDIDGFSSYVDKAENDTIKRDAILALDAIRQEMREVLKVDHGGVRIQYQGDNMIGVVHLPNDDKEKIAAAAADIAAGMQSSMGVTLPEVVFDALSLDVAVGIALEDTVLSSLGQYGRRNALVIGPAATKAEQIQLRLDAKQTGIDSATFDVLPEAVKELYEWNASAKAYVAEDLDASQLARVKEATAANGNRTLTPDHEGRFHIGSGATATAEIERVRPIRPYAE